LQQFNAKHCLFVHCVRVQQGAAMAYSYIPPDTLAVELQKQKQILVEQGFAVENRTEFGLPKVGGQD